MSLGGRAVDHVKIAVVEGDQGTEKPPPDPARRPAMEAVVDRRRRSVARWAILPPAADLQHMDDAADDAAVILPMGAGLVLRQQRLDRRPLRVIQPKIAHDPNSVVSQFES
jgi:hypothetical protein